MSQYQPRLHPKYVRSEALGKEITELCGYLYAATYQLLVKIAEFDRDELWGLPGVCSCAHWLNWQCGIGMGAAREKVRVARALAHLPKTSEAFSRGEISYSKVRAISRVGTPDNEDYLLHLAYNGTAYHLETVVRGYRRAKRLDETASANEQFDQRTIHLQWDDDGSLVIRGRLPAEVGAMVVKALEKAIDEAGRKLTPETTDDEIVPEIRAPIGQKRADALAGIVESFLKNGSEESSTADRYQVMVHVSAETLVEDLPPEQEIDDEVSHIENGPHVSAETSRRLCCDTSISRISEDKNREPISIGRKSRVIPPPMRRALRARDQGCRFPGCTHRYFIDGHHIRHWADGGETSLDNLVQLCRFHHRLVHEGGLECKRKSNGTIVFKDPNGNVTPVNGFVPPSLTNGVVVHLQEKLEDRFVDAQTCACGWNGEPMDRHLAVELLCARDPDGSW